VCLKRCDNWPQVWEFHAAVEAESSSIWWISGNVAVVQVSRCRRLDVINLSYTKTVDSRCDIASVVNAAEAENTDRNSSTSLDSTRLVDASPSVETPERVMAHDHPQSTELGLYGIYSRVQFLRFERLIMVKSCKSGFSSDLTQKTVRIMQIIMQHWAVL
jgi:hypothetical protein